MNHIRRIAFVGLGHMGEPMAARLVAAGFRVAAHDACSEVADAFVARNGGIKAATLADALQGTEAVITMLPNDAAVRSVMLGQGGVGTHLAASGIAIDMGTSSPPSTVAIGQQLAARGIAYLDAPVMGGVPFARDGSLDVMVGGDERAIDRCGGIFDALGRNTWRCGPSGSGHALKAVANFINAATLVTLIEGMTIGRKFGLDTALLARALTAMCAGRQHPLEKKVMPHVMTRKFATGMAMGLIAKDLEIAAELARDVGARGTIAEQTHSFWKEAVDRYGAEVDQTMVALLWEHAAGVTLE